MRSLVATVCAATMLTLVACKPSASTADKQGSPTPPVSATTAAPTPSLDYCAVVIKVNTDAGTLVNKKFVPSPQWTHAQVQYVADYALNHQPEFLAIAPPELKADIQVEIQFWQAVKDAGYDMLTPNLPAGIGEAAKHITAYQKAHCGIE